MSSRLARARWKSIEAQRLVAFEPQHEPREEPVLDHEEHLADEEDDRDHTSSACQRLLSFIRSGIDNTNQLERPTPHTGGR